MAEEHARKRRALVDLVTDDAKAIALDDYLEAQCAMLWIAAGHHKHRGVWREETQAVAQNHSDAVPGPPTAAAGQGRGP